MRVLVACEYSGTVRDAFAALGHDAWSCDLLPSEKPGNHYQGDVMNFINDGWNLMIAHPPCTYLASSGARWLYDKRYPNRKADQEKAAEFFMALMTAPIAKICVENPVGIMSRKFRPADQIVHPYYFGDEAQKATCLWLKNLLPLQHSVEADLFFQKTHVPKGEMHITKSGKKLPKWYSLLAANANRQKERSKTFPGIAAAMAEQWGGCLHHDLTAQQDRPALDPNEVGKDV